MATVTNKMFELTTADKIAKAKVSLYTKAPFFSYLVEYMQVFEAPESMPCPTMGVNGKNQMYYNKEFVDGLSSDELLGVLCHEVMHCALEHPWRGDGRNVVLNTPSGPVTLWNFAIDIVVNSIVLKNGFKLIKNGIIPDINTDSIEIFGTTVKDITNKSAEEIYDELKTAVKDQLQKNKGKGKGKGEGTTVYDYDGELGFDQHDFQDKDESGKAVVKAKDAKGEQSDKSWDAIMAEAATHAKQRGIEPAGMGRDYDILHKSKINWRAILRREIAKGIPHDYTWSRPARRFISQNIYMPSTISEEVKCLFFIDLSGSVSRTEMSAYMTEVWSIAQTFPSIECRIITHDSEVHDDFHITSSTKDKLKSLQCHGGGGTDMVCVHEYIQSKGYHKQYALGFHLTDGFGSFPDRSAVPSYIILSENHCSLSDLPSWSKGNICL